MKNLTINDLAKSLGVSKTTVSLVLNGKARESSISIEMEQRILTYIAQVGYIPNQYAQGLRNGKTRTIGMLVEDISDSFFSAIARQLEETAHKMGYKILYSSTENNTQKALEMLEVYKNSKVDGYIIAPAPGIEGAIRQLMAQGYPVVFFDRTLPGIDTDYVMVDNYASVYEATTHLKENGFRSISFITLSSDQNQMLERERGYLQAMAEAGEACMIKRVKYHDTKQHAVKELEEFFENNDYIEAVLFATNYIAANGLEALQNLGMKIPDQMGVAVFDDDNMFRLLSPPITAVAQPVRDIARHAIDLIMTRLTKTESPYMSRRIMLPNKLNIRESSQKRVVFQ